MSALLTEEQVLTVEETTPVLPDAELELLWFEALVEDEYWNAWSEALAYDLKRTADNERAFQRAWSEALAEDDYRAESRAWALSFQARCDEHKLLTEKMNEDPMFRLITYECEALMKRLKKRKRLAA
jgi:hypothetical protein